jgi:hypothetical protein
LLSLLLLAPGGACGDAPVQGLERNRCATNPDAPGCPPQVWPNEISYTNSDTWLRDNHDRLIRMEPKVLVLNFFNPSTPDIADLALRQAAALAVSSSFHGYADPAPPPFVEYKIWQVIDLTDDPPPPNRPLGSSLWPVNAAGMFDPVPLFSEEYANHYAIPDPSAPGRNLRLCELFERGIINEVWLAVGDDPPRGPLTMERKRAYDAAGVPTGTFENCAGGYGCLENVDCSVTVRLAHLAPERGLTCDVEIRTLPFESEDAWMAVPYLGANAPSFFNKHFRTLGLAFDSWYDICSSTGSAPCITYPTPSSVTGVDPAGAPFTRDPFLQGCGSARFPPNARFRNDFSNTAPVQSRCEHFGMKGPGGQDIFDTYTLDKVAAATAQFGADCGGGWQIYLRQNMPGLGNQARDVDGQPMKNWWPFAFY